MLQLTSHKINIALLTLATVYTHLLGYLKILPAFRPPNPPILATVYTVGSHWGDWGFAKRYARQTGFQPELQHS